MQLIQRLRKRHLMHKHRLNYEEYSLLISVSQTQGLLKDDTEAVKLARGNRPLVNTTLKDYTLRLQQRLLEKEYLEKKKTKLYLTPQATAAINEIGTPEPFLLGKYCTPAAISRITILTKAALILLFLYGTLIGGSLSLFVMTLLLALDTGTTLFFSHVDEASVKGNTKRLLIFASLILLTGYLFFRSLLAPMPAPRGLITLLLLSFTTIITFSLTAFNLSASTPGKELLRRIALIAGTSLVILILLKGVINPRPIPRSLFTSGIAFLGFLVLSALRYLQQKTGRRFTSFSMFHLAGQSGRNASLSLLVSFIGIISFFGIYHPDYLFPAGILLAILLQLLSLYRITRTRDARRRILEIWLEERCRSARRPFFYHWVRNLLTEGPVSKSGILTVHNSNYGKKKAGLTSGISIYLDRDHFFEKELDICLSNLLYDRSVHIDHDKFTRTTTNR